MRLFPIKTKAKLQYPDNESCYCQSKQIMATLRISGVTVVSSSLEKCSSQGTLVTIFTWFQADRGPLLDRTNITIFTTRDDQRRKQYFLLASPSPVQLNQEQKCSTSNSHPGTPDSTSRTRACSFCTSSVHSPRPSRCRLYILDSV